MNFTKFLGCFAVFLTIIASSFPLPLPTSGSDSDSSTSRTNECAICWEKMENGVIPFRCDFHRFHAPCAKRWVLSPSLFDKTCPTCRAFQKQDINTMLNITDDELDARRQSVASNLFYDFSQDNNAPGFGDDVQLPPPRINWFRDVRARIDNTLNTLNRSYAARFPFDLNERSASTPVSNQERSTSAYRRSSYRDQRPRQNNQGGWRRRSRSDVQRNNADQQRYSPYTHYTPFAHYQYQGPWNSPQPNAYWDNNMPYPPETYGNPYQPNPLPLPPHLMQSNQAEARLPPHLRHYLSAEQHQNQDDYYYPRYQSYSHGSAPMSGYPRDYQ